jgi:hypothetical protein
VIVRRGHHSEELKSAFDMDQLLQDGMVAHDELQERNDESSILGARVESDINFSTWLPYTVVSVDLSGDNTKRYHLVSDDGEVTCGVPEEHIRGLSVSDDALSLSDAGVSVHEGRTDRRSAGRTFPFLTSRRQFYSTENSDSGVSGQSRTNKQLLKRTWSALAPIESMCPVGVNAKSEPQRIPNPAFTSWKCDVGGHSIEVFVANNLVDFSPSIGLEFSCPESPSENIVIPSPADTTIVSLLCRLYRIDNLDIFCKEGHSILYSFVFRQPQGARRKNDPKETHFQKNCLGQPSQDMSIANKTSAFFEHASRSRKLSDSANFSEDDEGGPRIPCVGLDEICVQCLVRRCLRHDNCLAILAR